MKLNVDPITIAIAVYLVALFIAFAFATVIVPCDSTTQRCLPTEETKQP